jgi:hypothetical protein
MTQQQTQIEFVLAQPTVAHQWGKEDALTGVDNRASEYHVFGSVGHYQYLAGYKAGIEQLQAERELAQAQAPNSDNELEILSAALDGLRTLDTTHPAYTWYMETQADEEPIQFERATGYW